MKKYIVYYSFIVEAEEIDVAENLANDIYKMTLEDNPMVKDVEVTVRGI